MNVVLTRDAVKASKIEEKGSDESQGETVSGNVAEEASVRENNNKNILRDGPRHDTEIAMLKKQYGELLEINRVLKKQLESRDSIVKRQISDIHRLQGENKKLAKENDKVNMENADLKKEYESEKWMAERLRHDIRDLQMQLDFQDCYLQEQSHQSNLLESLLREIQKRNEAQEKEITQLRTQLHLGKEKLDNQIVDLQKMLGIKTQLRNQVA